MSRSKSARPPVVNGITEPITITIRGNMAAALRFSAHVRGVTPEANAMDAVRAAMEAEVESHFSTGEETNAWLMEGNDP